MIIFTFWTEVTNFWFFFFQKKSNDILNAKASFFEKKNKKQLQSGFMYFFRENLVASFLIEIKFWWARLRKPPARPPRFFKVLTFLSTHPKNFAIFFKALNSFNPVWLFSNFNFVAKRISFKWCITSKDHTSSFWIFWKTCPLKKSV